MLDGFHFVLAPSPFVVTCQRETLSGEPGPSIYGTWYITRVSRRPTLLTVHKKTKQKTHTQTQKKLFKGGSKVARATTDPSRRLRKHRSLTSAVHSPFFTRSSTWLCHLSLHCLPERPGNALASKFLESGKRFVRAPGVGVQLRVRLRGGGSRLRQKKQKTKKN